MAWAGKTRMVGADFTSANLQEAKFYAADFAQATLSSTVIRFAIWEGTHMEGCRGCPTDW